MDQSSSQRWGPQVYVHLEFGLSWNSSKPAKKHEVSYKSRGMSDRSPGFPRQVPAPNTNYLEAIHDFEQRQTRHATRASVPTRAHHHVPPENQIQEYYQAGYYLPIRPSHQGGQASNQQQRRMSRAESSSSHERGHSAPPPIGDNPWDVSVEHDPAGEPSTAAVPRQAPDQWKALPHPPSQYRLGEDGMPWSSWSWPLGYDPAATPRDDDMSNTLPSAQSGPADHVSPYEASPLSVSVYSPSPTGRDGVETGRARELGALSAAMMTVDNGFENQWWNQGNRESVHLTATTDDLGGFTHSHSGNMAAITDDLGGFTHSHSGSVLSRNRWSARSLGWAVAETPAAMTSATIRSVNPSDMVSPMTSAADFSPPATYQSRYPQMQRSMSTRSEELWFTERNPL
ncbi:hypothetical protein V8F06_003111 [Rhypophila decipiens]